MTTQETNAPLRVDAIFTDFDGVLSDNKVYVDDAGRESVACNRADGLAFDALRKLGIPIRILSTEKNPVVAARAGKLKVPAIQGVADKLDTLLTICRDEGLELERVMYVGNDLNDLLPMMRCGIRVCPADSHPRVLALANFPLATRGGEGVMREVVEELMQFDLVKVLYS